MGCVMGRKPLSLEEKEKRIKTRSHQQYELRKQMNAEGFCRCGESLSVTSKVYCEKHLSEHRETASRIRASQSTAYKRYNTIQCNAKARDIQVVISREDFEKWFDATPKICAYCKTPEQSLIGNKDKKQRGLSVDRKDNKQGYEVKNLALSCFKCNRSKSSFFTSEEWVSICELFVKPRINDYHQ